MPLIKSGSKEMSCTVCGKTVSVPRYRHATFKACSRSCSAKLGAVGIIKLTCKQCRIEFIVPRWRNKARYCSLNCRDLARSKPRHRVECIVCNRPILRLAIHLHKSGKNVCGAECRGKLSRRVRPKGAGYARRWAKTRGLLQKCDRCNFSKYTEILVVHHKDRNRSNNNPSNFEILCPNCHATEHLVDFVETQNAA